MTQRDALIMKNHILAPQKINFLRPKFFRQKLRLKKIF